MSALPNGGGTRNKDALTQGSPNSGDHRRVLTPVGKLSKCRVHSNEYAKVGCCPIDGKWPRRRSAGLASECVCQHCCSESSNDESSEPSRTGSGRNRPTMTCTGMSTPGHDDDGIFQRSLRCRSPNVYNNACVFTPGIGGGCLFSAFEQAH